MKLGEFEIYALSDGTFTLDGGQLFGVVPKMLWEKKIPADSRNRVRLSLTCLLVRTGKQNVLVETGIGDKLEPKQADIYGVDHSTSLPAELQKLGLACADIDVVINTHLHFDHCGWNTRRQDGKLVATFPRARYVIQRREWEHALQPSERDRASYLGDFFRPAEGQTTMLDGDQEILPGISVVVAPGHTGHMQCVRIESQSERAVFLSDLVPTLAHLANPWITSFDLYPMETLASKKRLLPQLAAEQAVVVFPHEPCTPWVRLVQIDGKIATQSVS